MLSFPLACDLLSSRGSGQKVRRFSEGRSHSRDRRSAIFIIDKGGKIAFSKTWPLDRVPENEEIFEALRQMSGGTSAHSSDE